jgi:hypothetical protein
MGRRCQNAPEVGLYAVAFKLFSFDAPGGQGEELMVFPTTQKYASLKMRVIAVARAG